MKKEDLIKRIRESAKHTKKLREDPRYKQVMGFLVQMGFLNTNQKLQAIGHRKIPVRDAIWAGKNIEPRILEVLPAAFARLERRFDGTPEELRPLKLLSHYVRDGKVDGPDFEGVPYKLLKPWYSLPLSDKRTKTPDEKKLACTFRLKPKVVKRLEELAASRKSNRTEVLENLILNSKPTLKPGV
jgi:hypothetical protein